MLGKLRIIRDRLFQLLEDQTNNEKKEQLNNLINFYQKLIRDRTMDHVDLYEKLLGGQKIVVDDKDYNSWYRTLRIKLLENICSNPALRDKLYQKNIVDCIVFINEEGEINMSVADKETTNILRNRLIEFKREFYEFKIVDIDFNKIKEIVMGSNSSEDNFLKKLTSLKLTDSNISTGGLATMGSIEDPEKIKTANELHEMACKYKPNKDLPNPANYLFNQGQARSLWKDYQKKVSDCQYDVYRNIMTTCSMAKYMQFMYDNFSHDRKLIN